jgi:hypothetical protein
MDYHLFLMLAQCNDINGTIPVQFHPDQDFPARPEMFQLLAQFSDGHGFTLNSFQADGEKNRLELSRLWIRLSIPSGCTWYIHSSVKPSPQYSPSVK